MGRYINAVGYNNTSAVKVLIDFGGDRTIKTLNLDLDATPLDAAKKYNRQNTVKLLTEFFPSEE